MLHQDVIEALKVADDKEEFKPKTSFHEQEEPAKNEEFQKETQPDSREQCEPMAVAHIASEEESQNQCPITQASNTLPTRTKDSTTRCSTASTSKATSTNR